MMISCSSYLASFTLTMVMSRASVSSSIFSRPSIASSHSTQLSSSANKFESIIVNHCPCLQTSFSSINCWILEITKTLPKAQRTRGLSSYYRISIKHQLQNFNQTSASQLNLKLNSWPNLASEYWPRFNFVTSSKHQRQNADQTSASKSRLNFNFKQSWLKCSKSEQKLSFMTKPQLPNLQQTVANTILITNISNSNNLNKFWVGIFTRQGHINQVY